VAGGVELGVDTGTGSFGFGEAGFQFVDLLLRGVQARLDLGALLLMEFDARTRRVRLLAELGELGFQIAAPCSRAVALGSPLCDLRLEDARRLASELEVAA
jgi:hypothetical protein